jgi:hypothetical protein
MAIATATAIAGLALSAGSAGASFAQAAKQRRLQSEAQEAAARSMAEARNKLQVNFYDQMAIQKEPYELQREAMLVQGAQAMEGAREGERGVAATAGRLQMAQNEAQAGIRTAMGKEMTDIQQLQLAEESRLRDIGAQMDLEEAAGAQQAAADAQRAEAASVAQGWESVTSLGQQAMAMAPLYEKSASARQLGRLEKQYAAAVAKGGLDPKFLDAQGKPLPFQQAVSKMPGYGFDVSGVGGMTQESFADYMIKQDARNIKNMRGVNYFAPTVKPQP